MDRHRRRTRLGRAGYTLVEIIISMLIMAVLVSSVFTVALSTQGGDIKAHRRVLATQAARSLSSHLRAYVTGDNTTQTIRGPNTGNLLNNWSMNIPGVQQDSMGNVWALQAGTHVITCHQPPPADNVCFLPKQLRDMGGTMQYTVSGSPPKVDITVNWNE